MSKGKKIAICVAIGLVVAGGVFTTLFFVNRISGYREAKNYTDEILGTKDTVAAYLDRKIDGEKLTEDDKKVLAKAMKIYRESAPIKQSEIDQYKGLMYHSVPVTAILQAYSICQIQPDPGFSDDNNYLKNAFAEEEHVDFSKGLEKQTVITEDGKDITGMVEKAVAWLTENTF